MNLLISGFLNALCAWLLFRGAPAVPVDFWSLFIDTVITCYLVSVCTAFFATASARRYLERGMHVSLGAGWAARLDALPRAWLPMGCCLFGACLPVLVAAFGIAFGACGTGFLETGQFMLFKALWGGMYGALVCIIILLRHLAWEGGGHA